MTLKQKEELEILQSYQGTCGLGKEDLIRFRHCARTGDGTGKREKLAIVQPCTECKGYVFCTQGELGSEPGFITSGGAITFLASTAISVRSGL